MTPLSMSKPPLTFSRGPGALAAAESVYTSESTATTYRAPASIVNDTDSLTAGLKSKEPPTGQSQTRPLNLTPSTTLAQLAKTRLTSVSKEVRAKAEKSK